MAVTEAELWTLETQAPPTLKLVPGFRSDKLDEKKTLDTPFPRMSFSGPGALAEMQAVLDAEDHAPAPVEGRVPRPPVPSSLIDMAATYSLLLDIEPEGPYAPQRRTAALAIEQAVAAERATFDMVAGRLAIGS